MRPCAQPLAARGEFTARKQPNSAQDEVLDAGLQPATPQRRRQGVLTSLAPQTLKTLKIRAHFDVAQGDAEAVAEVHSQGNLLKQPPGVTLRQASLQQHQK